VNTKKIKENEKNEASKLAEFIEKLCIKSLEIIWKRMKS